MNLLVGAIERHPTVVLMAVLLAIALTAFAMDVFVGWAERDEPAGPQR